VSTITVTIAQPLAVGAALFAIGVLAASFRRQPAAMLRALPLMGAGAIIALGGASRLASSNADPIAGQELAVVVAIAVLAFTVAGAAALLRGQRP
jgi:NADH:ubiquinone oxidoreductase subunit K